jgi:hypothetical protein
MRTPIWMRSECYDYDWCDAALIFGMAKSL